VVVLNTGDPVTMTKWIDTTPALLDMWYGGQEGGHALAAICLAMRIPRASCPSHCRSATKTIPPRQTIRAKNLEVNYAEGIYVGYRYYDTKNVEPQFPFGFGLSYTKFEYSSLVVGPERITKTNRSMSDSRCAIQETAQALR
jgi:beta-glucosidase